jgi:hypothetical protein
MAFRRHVLAQRRDGLARGALTPPP